VHVPVVVTITAKPVCGVLRCYEIVNILWPKKNYGKSQDVQVLGVNYATLKTSSAHQRQPLPPAWMGECDCVCVCDLNVCVCVCAEFEDNRRYIYSQRQEESEEGAEDWGQEDLGCHTD
jgi:hypothetical protein